MFALKRIDAIDGKQEFFQLVENGLSQIDCFLEDHNSNSQYRSEYKTILKYMELVSNNTSLPKEKFRDITPKKSLVKEYEFKSKHLRVYAFHLERTGKIVVLLGLKTNQDADIRRFRNTKNDYLEYLDNDKQERINRK